MIELKHMSKLYPHGSGEVHAVRDANLHIAAGEIFGIIGASGAGKSTLLRCMNLLERPSRGSVLVDDCDLMSMDDAALRTARRRMGMVFQHFNLLSTKTVFDNVALPLRLQAGPTRVKKDMTLTEKVQDMLALVGLKDKASAYPDQLSGGQKQRVAIARALITEPRVLLCDEMTSSLDPEMTQSILKLIKTINQKMGVTVVLITHEMDVIKQVADRVAVLDSGEVVECDDVLTVFRSPQTEIAKSLVHSTLQLDLPPSLNKQLVSEPAPGRHAIVRILFSGAATNEPVISEFMTQQQVQLNILQANMDYLHGETLGIMLVKVEGDGSVAEQFLAYLSSKHLQADIVGYL